MSADKGESPAKIALFLADVDGTLVTKEKVITERTKQAVRALRAAGVRFAVTSGRPPKGMKMVIDELEITELTCAFNGGLFVHPDLSIAEQHVLNADVVQRVIKTIEAHKLDVWVYVGGDWFIRDPKGAHVDREEHTVKFPPIVVPNFDAHSDNVTKIVGVSDDFDLVAKCEADVQQEFGKEVSAARSQPYYLDVTHPAANKGEVVKRLSALLGIPTEQIATIGDMPSDVLMFKESGLSIAMGNSSDEVKKQARETTTSNEEEGVAIAIERLILQAQQAKKEGQAA